MSKVTSGKKKGRVLVVNDHEILASGLRENLTDIYNVRIALDGETALTVAEKYHPHIALIDFYLPGHSGIDVMKGFDSITPDTVSILTSIVDNPRIIAKAVNAGAQGYFKTEFEPEALRSYVQDAFEKWPRRHREGEEYFPDIIGIPDIAKRFSQIGNGNDLALYYDPERPEWWWAMKGFIVKIVNGDLRRLRYGAKMTVDEVFSDVSEYLISLHYQPILRFDSEKGTFRNWMTSITRFRLLDRIEKKERHAFLPLDELKREPASSKSDPAVLLEREEQFSILRKFLEELPREQRDAILEKQDIEHESPKENLGKKPSERTKRRRRETGWIRLKEWFKTKFGED